MKHAYLIIAHDHLNNLPKLINRLYFPGVTFFVHVDARAKFDERLLEENLHEGIDVFFIEDRMQINWGGFSLTSCILQMLQAAISKSAFDFISLISGQDYPIMSNNDIADLLSKNAGREFIEYFPLPDETQWRERGGSDRFEYYWLIDDLGFEKSRELVLQQKKENLRRQFPSSLQPYGGSNWFTITGNCARYIIGYLSAYPEVINFFKYTFISDEMLIPTIVLNSDFRRQVVNNNLRYIDWKSGPFYPRPLTFKDLPLMLDSGKCLARKITDPALQDQLDDIIKKPSY